MYEFTISKEILFSGRINYRQYYMFVKYIIENYLNNYFFNLLSDKKFQDTNLNILYDETDEYYKICFNVLNGNRCL